MPSLIRTPAHPCPQGLRWCTSTTTYPLRPCPDSTVGEKGVQTGVDGRKPPPLRSLRLDSPSASCVRSNPSRQVPPKNGTPSSDLGPPLDTWTPTVPGGVMGCGNRRTTTLFRVFKDLGTRPTRPETQLLRPHPLRCGGGDGTREVSGTSPSNRDSGGTALVPEGKVWFTPSRRCTRHSQLCHGRTERFSVPFGVRVLSHPYHDRSVRSFSPTRPHVPGRGEPSRGRRKGQDWGLRPGRKTLHHDRGGDGGGCGWHGGRLKPGHGTGRPSGRVQGSTRVLSRVRKSWVSSSDNDTIGTSFPPTRRQGIPRTPKDPGEVGRVETV